MKDYEEEMKTSKKDIKARFVTKDVLTNSKVDYNK